MRRALLDTSVVISLARGEELALADPPEEAAIAAITLCGLHHGVLAAGDRQRPGRLATHANVERRFTVLDLDARVAPHYGLIVAAARREGRTPGTAEARIAATAAADSLPVLTRDRDFAALPGVDVVLA